MDEHCRKEIVELHQFFQDWMTGRLPTTDQAFARFSDVLDVEFQIITPSARVIGRDELLTSFRGAHGARGGDPDFQIRIEDHRDRPLGSRLHLATYEEWQGTGNGMRGRLSTALFGRREGTPNGLIWLHVHETWLP